MVSLESLVQSIPNRPDIIFDLNQYESLEDSHELRLGVLWLVWNTLSVWLNLTPECLQVVRISGAMTNSVFRVITQVQNGLEECEARLVGEPEALLLRVYGPDINWMFERARELQWIGRLAAAGITPRWLAIFGNGRIEEFIPSETLKSSMIQQDEWIVKIARKLAQIHAFVDHLDVARPHPKDEIWMRILNWGNRALVAYKTLAVQKAQLRRRDASSLDLLIKSGIFEVEPCGLVAKHRARIPENLSPIVLAHCDLHHGNLLRRLSDNEVVAVDYEYAALAPRGFDLANVFCEHASDYLSGDPATLDYNLFPDAAKRRLFISAYLESNDEAQVARVEAEAMAYLPLVHLHWGYWGIIQAAKKSPSFDYLYYGFQRFRQYYALVQGANN